MKDNLRAHIALFIVNLIYGINFTVAKEVMQGYLPPATFILIRVSCASILFLLLWFFYMKKEKIERKDIPLIFFCGLTGIAINQLLFFEGLHLTTNINGAIIMTTTPVLVLLASFFLLKEKIAVTKVSGIALGITGAVSLILYGKFMSVNENTWKGDIMIFINAVSYAVYLVSVKPLIKKYNAVTVITFVFLAGFIFVLPFGMWNAGTVQWQNFSTHIWYSIVFVVIGTTFFAYLLNNYALAKVSPTVVSAYIYLQPAIATFISLYVKHEKVQAFQMMACTLIFAGVYLVSKPQKQN